MKECAVSNIQTICPILSRYLHEHSVFIVSLMITAKMDFVLSFQRYKCCLLWCCAVDLLPEPDRFIVSFHKYLQHHWSLVVTLTEC